MSSSLYQMECLVLDTVCTQIHTLIYNNQITRCLHKFYALLNLLRFICQMAGNSTRTCTLERVVHTHKYIRFLCAFECMCRHMLFWFVVCLAYSLFVWPFMRVLLSSNLRIYLQLSLAIVAVKSQII